MILRFLLMTLLLMISGVQVFAGTRAVNIQDVYKDTDFTGVETVYLYQGDDYKYTNIQFQESGKLITIPSKWEKFYPDYKGICWYRIPLYFSHQSLDNRPLAISLGEIEVADETYFNGHLIGKGGDIEQNKMYYDIPRLYFIPRDLIQWGRTNIVAIRVLGGFGISGPYAGRMKIGTLKSLQMSQQLTDTLQLILAVVYIILAFNFLLLWLFLKDEHFYLTFSLYCLAVFIYSIIRNQLIFSFYDDFTLKKNIEYLVLLLPIPLFTLFTAQFFDPKRIKWARIYTLAHLVPAIGMLFIHNVEVRYQIVLVFQYSWAIPIIYILILIIKKTLEKDRDALLVLPSLVLNAVFILIDILRSRAMVNTSVSFFPFALLLFVISFAIVLNRKVVSLYTRVRQLNTRLEEEVEKRTEQLTVALDKMSDSNQALQGLTLMDELTGLYNRRFFNKQFETELNRIRRYPDDLALIMLDVDDFKKINDTYGHIVGDKVLKQLALILKENVNRDIDVVSRYGGEEFVIILPNTNTNSAAYLAESIRKAVERTPFDIEGHMIRVTISLGVASKNPNIHKDYDRILHFADKALYSAKAYGKNKVFSL